jgi:hypothetical protein
MKTHFWYVAKISWRETNPPYHAIIQCRWDGADPIIDVIESDGRSQTEISKLYYFDLIREIEELNAWASKMKKVRS